jgi:hypothetical protein
MLFYSVSPRRPIIRTFLEQNHNYSSFYILTLFIYVTKETENCEKFGGNKCLNEKYHKKLKGCFTFRPKNGAVVKNGALLKLALFKG